MNLFLALVANNDLTWASPVQYLIAAGFGFFIGFCFAYGDDAWG